MSELEIQRRKEYKLKRRKWTIIQLTAIILLTAIALSSLLIYNKMNRTYHIEYTEKSNIEYMVQYRDNEFFENEWIGMEQTYISSLIEGITADFAYKFNTASTDLGFRYRYKIDAQLLIASKDAGTPYYSYEENIFPPEETSTQNDASVEVKKSVWIDYKKFNRMAQSFIQTYDLINISSCTLIITLEVDILTSNKQSGDENQNRYTTALNIPLALDSFNVHTTSSSADNEVKVLEYRDTSGRQAFAVTAIAAFALDVLLALLLFVFLHLTKNEDITYASKIRRILRSYGSFIQRMEGEFDYEGYQSVMIKSFTELLGIRDTIQSPVLMSENHDETMTRFLIPTSNARILYVFEIKVDNYDEIYNKVNEEEKTETEALPVEAVEAISIEPDIEPPVAEKVIAVEPKVEKVNPATPTVERQMKTGDMKKITRTVTTERCVRKKVVTTPKNKKSEQKTIKYPIAKVLAVVLVVHIIRKIIKRY